MQRAVLATGMWLTTMGLGACATPSYRVEPSPSQSPGATHEPEMLTRVGRPVPARAVRPGKQFVPIPRTFVSGRVRSDQARPTPRRPWFELVPDHPSAPGARP
jgi:hypothetical protein